MILAAPSTAPANQYAVDPMPALVLGGNLAGDSVEHRLQFAVRAGELETYQALVRYPAGFTFNGFDQFGPPNTPVGAYELDLDGDGAADVSVPLRSTGPSSAYLDVIGDQSFSPGLEPTLTVSDEGTLAMRLPYGGDARAATKVVPFGGTATVVLLAGAFINPSSAGRYAAEATLLSVDPDTDGPSDGVAPDPLRFDASLDIEILPAGDTPFASLEITRSTRIINPRGSDAFRVYGRFALGAGSDGIAPGAEEVAIDYGPFSAVLPPGALAPRRGEHLYVGRFGLQLVRIAPDGSFIVWARALELPGLGATEPATFRLRIGDDAGQVDVTPSPAGTTRRRGR